MARSGEPIVAGPWLGEVGFELLYWVPFLAWFAERVRRRARPSAGGVARRNGVVVPAVCGALRRRVRAASRRRRSRRSTTPASPSIGEQKQTRITAFERELLGTIASAPASESGRLLHPSGMYDVLNPFWWGHRADRVGAPARAVPEARGARRRRRFRSCPRLYVAVKFYFNDCFPATDANRGVRASTLAHGCSPARARWSRSRPGLNIDDHGGVRVRRAWRDAPA